MDELPSEPEDARMASYSFTTIWRHRAPIDAVYDAITDSLAWPEWWPAVTKVEELEPGDPVTGSVASGATRSRAPCRTPSRST